MIGNGSIATRSLRLVLAGLLLAEPLCLGIMLVPSSAGPPTWTAVDVIATTGLASTSESWSLTPTDYDGDGFQDVLIGYHDHGAKMFRNNGNGTFTRVAPSAWPEFWSPMNRVDRHGCAAGDVNRDGRTDYYCAVGRTLANQVKTAPNDNELWLQQQDGRFTDVGTAWGVGDPRGRGRSALFIDANGDGYKDLYVTNQLPRPDDADGGVGGENKFFLNVGGTAFVSAPQFGLDLFLGEGTCVQKVDFNQDGWPDIFVCGADAESGLSIFLNRHGTTFHDGTARACLAQTLADADLIDLDRDGDLRSRRHLADGGVLPVERRRLPRAPQDDPLASGRGDKVAEADVDRDGDLDIYSLTTTFGTSANPDDYLLVNTGNLSFTSVRVPSASGVGDDVEPLRMTLGSVGFLVLNGREVEGPAQFIRLTTGSSISPMRSESGSA